MVEKTNNLSSSSELMPISNKQNYIAQSNKNDSLKEFWFDFIKRRWLLISGFTCLVITAIVYWAFQQSPIYQGKFLLLLEKPNFTDNQNQLENNQLQNNQLQNNSANSSVDYSTEVKLLGSASVLAPILKEISLEYPDIYQDINLADSKNFKINQVEQSKIIEVLFTDENPEKVQFVLDKLSNHYLEKQLNPFSKNINEGLKFIQSQTSQLQNKVNAIENKLQNLRKQNNLIDPQITAQELTRQLVSDQQEYSQTKVLLQEARNNFNKLQKQLNLTPQQAIVIISLSESKRYQDLQKQLAQIDLELAKESAIFTEESPIIINLREKKENTLQLIKAEIAKFTSRSSRNNAKNTTDLILNSNIQIKSELAQTLLNQERKVQELDIKQKNLEKSLAELTKKNTQMPAIISQYNKLQRELNISADSLKRWLQTKEDLEIKKAKNRVTWTIISPTQLQALSLLPFSGYNLIILVVGSLILCTFLIFTIDLIDDSIYNIFQLKRATIRPVLASIPQNKKYKFLPINREKFYPSFAKILKSQPDNSNSLFGLESFYDMYTNLHILNSDNLVNSVVISSVNSRVGATSVSLNFAKAVAAMGKKVLLIDTNFKNPQINHFLELKNSQGLSDVLTEKTGLFSVIQTIPEQNNLSVITAGNVSSHIYRLFFTPILKTTINNLATSQMFDLIIYDTSSLLELSGTKVIASRTDGVILVVEMGQTKGKKVKQVVEQLNIARIPVLGVVANGITC